MRTRAIAESLVVLLAIAGSVRAAPVEGAADQVLEAVRAGDGEALARQAKADDPDPWLVANALCAKGEFEAAIEFAKAAPRKDVDKLAAWLGTEDARSDQAAARRGLAEAYARRKLGEIAKAKQALPKAQEALAEAMGRVQREAKAAADVLYPEAASLGEIRGWLGEGEALVL